MIEKDFDLSTARGAMSAIRSPRFRVESLSIDDLLAIVGRCIEGFEANSPIVDRSFYVNTILGELRLRLFPDNEILRTLNIRGSL